MFTFPALQRPSSSSRSRDILRWATATSRPRQDSLGCGDADSAARLLTWSSLAGALLVSESCEKGDSAAPSEPAASGDAGDRRRLSRRRRGKTRRVGGGTRLLRRLHPTDHVRRLRGSQGNRVLRQSRALLLERDAWSAFRVARKTCRRSDARGGGGGVRGNNGAFPIVGSGPELVRAPRIWRRSKSDQDGSRS